MADNLSEVQMQAMAKELGEMVRPFIDTTKPFNLETVTEAVHACRASWDRFFLAACKDENGRAHGGVGELVAHLADTYDQFRAEAAE